METVFHSDPCGMHKPYIVLSGRAAKKDSVDWIIHEQDWAVTADDLRHLLKVRSKVKLSMRESVVEMDTDWTRLLCKAVGRPYSPGAAPEPYHKVRDLHPKPQERYKLGREV